MHAMIEMLVAAMEKAHGTDAVAVARALGGLAAETPRLGGLPRRDDARRGPPVHPAAVVSSMQRVATPGVRFDNEGSGYGFQDRALRRAGEDGAAHDLQNGAAMRSVDPGPLPASKIREVANRGMGRADVLAFWFGEATSRRRLRARCGDRVAAARRDLLCAQPRHARAARALAVHGSRCIRR
jgi:hypothetical protein